MAIEFRDVTQLEPLEALEDGDYLVVVRDGVAKRISKADAKFGGGTATTFYANASDLSGENDITTLYSDPDLTQEITAGQMRDAFSAGPCRISATHDSSHVQAEVLFIKYNDTQNSVSAAFAISREKIFNVVIGGLA